MGSLPNPCTLQRLCIHCRPFPPLPVEFVCFILEMTAAEHRSTALQLICVSKVVHIWIIPIIFRTIILHTSEQVSPFHLALPSAYPQAAHVKNLFIVSNASLAKVLSTCRQMERLVLGFSWPKYVQARLAWCTPWEVVLYMEPTRGRLKTIQSFKMSRIFTWIPCCLTMPRCLHQPSNINTRRDQSL
jgi:hypothetical protein